MQADSLPIDFLSKVNYMISRRTNVSIVFIMVSICTQREPEEIESGLKIALL